MLRRQASRTRRDDTHRWQLRVVARITLTPSHSVPLSVSPCGSLLVTSHMLRIQAFRVPDLGQAWELTVPERVYPAQNPSFSATGEMVLGLGHRVTIHQLEPGGAPGKSRSFLVPVEINNCALSPDGSRLAVYDNRAVRLTLYDASPGWRPWPRRPLLSVPGGFAFSVFEPGSRWLAYDDPAPPGIAVVDRQGRSLAQLKPREKASSLYACHRPVLFAPGGERLVLGSYGGLELIDWRAGTSVELLSKQHWVGGIALSPDGRLLAETDRAGLTLYGLEEGQELPVLAELPLQAFALEFLPGSRQLAVGTQEGELILLELTPREPGAASPPAPGPAWERVGAHAWPGLPITWERFDSDAADPGMRTATFVPELSLAEPQPDGERWALADGWTAVRVVATTGRQHYEVQVPSEGDRVEYDGLALSPEGGRLAVGRRNSLFIWELASGRLWSQEGYSQYYKDHTHGLAFSSEDRLWWASRDGLECLDLVDPSGWHWRGQGQAPMTVEGACLTATWGVLLGGRKLTCHGYAGERKLRWEKTLEQQEVRLAACATRLAIAGSGTVEVLEASDGTRIRQRRLLELPKQLQALGFVSDSWLLVQWEDRTVLWDLAADRLFYPTLRGRLLACAGVAVLVHEGQVEFWRFGDLGAAPSPR